MIVFKDHGVGKKSFLTANPLPILNTWRHVFSMGVGKKIFSDIKPPPILNTCTIRQKPDKHKRPKLSEKADCRHVKLIRLIGI